MMKPRLILWVVALGWFGGAVALQLQSPPKNAVTGRIPAPKIDVVPLTITYEERIQVIGSPALVTSIATLAIRPDGSTARATVFKAMDGATVVNRIRSLGFANGDRATVNDVERIVTAVRSKEAFSSDLPLLTPLSRCAADFAGQQWATPSGEDTILGYKVIAFRRDQPTRRITTWRSPDLGCVEIRRLAEFLDETGRVTDQSDFVAITILRGPPEPKLFSAPRGYLSVAPSEHYRRSAKRSNKEVDGKVLQSYISQDETYERQKIDDLTELGLRR